MRPVRGSMTQMAAQLVLGAAVGGLGSGFMLFNMRGVGVLCWLDCASFLNIWGEFSMPPQDMSRREKIRLNA